MARMMIASLTGAVVVQMVLGVPVLEQQFYATIKGVQYQNGSEYRTFGSKMYYDPPNQRYREDVKDRYVVADYKNNVGFEIDASGSCTLRQMPNPPALPIVAPSAVDAGPATVGGQPAELWKAVIAGNLFAQTVIVAVQTQPAAGRNPVRLLTNASYQEPSCDCHPPCKEYPCFVSDVNDYSTDLHVGPMPDSLFAKPANCQPSNETLAFNF
jgi:hypothetical protein